MGLRNRLKFFTPGIKFNVITLPGVNGTMDREQAIKSLQIVGAEIAKDMGYTEMVIGEDRQKGVWREKFTRLLEAEYGECTSDIRWFKKNRPVNLNFGDNVEFKFRFENPKLLIDHRKVDGSLASIELSDFSDKAYAAMNKELDTLKGDETDKKEEIRNKYKNLIHTGKFKISEIQVFMGDDGKGLEYLDMLRTAWSKVAD